MAQIKRARHKSRSIAARTRSADRGRFDELVSHLLHDKEASKAALIANGSALRSSVRKTEGLQNANRLESALQEVLHRPSGSKTTRTAVGSALSLGRKMFSAG